MRHRAIAPRQALKIVEIELAATDGPTVPIVLAAAVELPAETTSSSR